MQIRYNKTARTSAPEYIVIHDTGNRSKGADAVANYKYFNGGDRGSSADFFVDDKQTLCVNDYKKYYTWHCGDGRGRYGITNANSVGIEICINSDGDYNKAFKNAVILTRRLMKELYIDVGHVVRHYDASRKNCPNTMSADNWALWRKFKEELMNNDIEKYTDDNAVLWELKNRGFISNADAWQEIFNQNDNVRILAQNMLHEIRKKEAVIC